MFKTWIISACGLDQQRRNSQRAGFGWHKRVFPLLMAMVVCGTIFSQMLFADDVAFEATVRDNVVPMGTAVELTLTVRGDKDVEVPKLPPVDGFDVRYVGPTTKVVIINGSYSTSKLFNYLLLPLREGKFTIPAFEMTIKGQSYATQAISVDIVPAGQAGSNTGSSDAGTVDISSRIKLQLLVPRNECYVNETLPVVIKLYYQDVPLQDVTMPELKNDGISLGDYTQPRQYEESLDGMRYHVVEFQTSISPTRSGQLQLGPVTINANMLYKVEGRHSPFGGRVFDDDFFGSFFSTYQKRPLTISSRSLALEVKPLPDEGRPEGFSGAVGQFDLQVEIGPSEVRAGDPVTLKASVQGAGNLKTIKMPQIASEGFKVYDPQIKEEGGRKTLEQVLIPTKDDVREVPAVTFSYFDPVRAQYMSITKGPFPLKVTAPAPGEEFHAVGYANTKPQTLSEDLGKDIIFIKDRPGRLKETRVPFLKDWPFFGALIIFLNIWGIFLGFFLYRRRLQTDEAFARRQRAPRAARAAWAQADKAASAGQTKVFYEALEQGLRAFLADALSLPIGDAFGERAREELRQEGIPDQMIDRLKSLEQSIEMARFASADSTPEQMRRNLEEAKAVTRAVEDQL